ncbi:hypothetical protein MMUR_23400 [Mycolicibacterium murale]|uniref:Uncharacterized protein n=1 Tax=Mycolicibacterium murale TaxID=182220 RepID=A0A7I9WKI3_9MYCO|nr:hypothetical protein MMUR_23400 [Mycolicibacterium murale]
MRSSPGVVRGLPRWTGAEVVSMFGKYSLLVGMLVYVCPVGVVMVMVPSGAWVSDQPGWNVLIRW